MDWNAHIAKLKAAKKLSYTGEQFLLALTASNELPEGKEGQLEIYWNLESLVGQEQALLLSGLSKSDIRDSVAFSAK